MAVAKKRSELASETTTKITGINTVRGIKREFVKGLFDDHSRAAGNTIIEVTASLTIDITKQQDYIGKTVLIRNGAAVTIGVDLDADFLCWFKATGTNGTLHYPTGNTETISTSKKNPVELIHLGGNVYDFADPNSVASAGGGGGGLIKFTLAQNVYLEHNFFQFDFYGTADADLVLKNTNGAAGETAIGTEDFYIGVENFGTANTTIKTETGLTLVKEDLTAFTGSAILEPGKRCFLRSTTTSGELRVIGDISDIDISPYTEEYMLNFTTDAYLGASPITNFVTKATDSTLGLIDSGTHDASQGRLVRQVDIRNFQSSNSMGYEGGAVAEFPASVTIKPWYLSAANGDSRQLDFEGFDPAKTYKVRLFASTASSGARVGKYTIIDAVNTTGAVQTVDAYNNTIVLEWLGVKPDVNGKFTFLIAQNTATDLAYVNGIGITVEP